MPDSIAVLRSAHTALDSANARRLLTSAGADRARVADALTQCFFHGSAAAASVAAAHVRTNANPALADALRTLPAAVPPRNADALADVCARFAVSLGSNCASPLVAFAFAADFCKGAALRVVERELDAAAAKGHEAFAGALAAVWDFLAEVLKGGVRDSFRILAVRALCRVGRARGGVIASRIVTLLVDNALVATPAPGMAPEEGVHFFAFLATELADIVMEKASALCLTRACILRSLESGSGACVVAVWRTARLRVLDAFTTIGPDVVAHALVYIAGICAVRGDLHAAVDILDIASLALQDLFESGRALDPIVAAYVDVVCVSAGTLLSAAGAVDGAVKAASLRKLVRDRRAPCLISSNNTRASMDDELHVMRTAAKDLQFSRCALAFGLLASLKVQWRSPKLLCEWLEHDFESLVLCPILKSAPAGSDAEASILASSFVVRDTSLATSAAVADDLDSDDARRFLAWSLATVCVVCMKHSHIRVRIEASYAFATVPHSPSLFFYLPTLMTVLEAERHSAAAVQLIRAALGSPSLIRDSDTCRVVIATWLRLMQAAEQQVSSSTAVREVGLMALSDAACVDASLACSILLGEIEKVKDSFELTSAPLKAAAAAATMRLIAERPARGPNFIPFITLCITAEAAALAPQTASLCFLAMKCMVDEEVLDAPKAIKIVFKAFASPTTVPRPARISFISLLGCVARSASTKKGRPVAARAIMVLRDCVLELSPQGENASAVLDGDDERLSWGEVGQAAASLSEFEASDILRVAHDAEEPLEDVDAERSRLNAIETECMIFVQRVLEVVGRSSLWKKSAAAPKQFGVLLDKIAEFEWIQRPRSAFDPEKLTKMRATMEALRRARKASTGGNGDGSSPGTSSSCSVVEETKESVVAQFEKGVQALPDGAIKALCRACAALLVCDSSENTTSEGKQVESACALRALTAASGLSPALPWAALLSHAVISSVASEEVKSAAIGALFALPSDDVAARNVRARLFSCGAAMDERIAALPAAALGQLAVCLMADEDEIAPLLQLLRSEKTPDEAISWCVDATLLLPEGSAHALPAFDSILDRVAKAPCAQLTVIRTLATAISAALSGVLSRDMEILALSDSNWSPRDKVNAHIALTIGRFEQVLAVLSKLKQWPLYDRTLCHSLGHAMRGLSSALRHELLLEGGATIGGVAAAGTSALLPITDAKLALAAAVTVADPADRRAVSVAVATAFAPAKVSSQTPRPQASRVGRRDVVSGSPRSP